MIDKLIPISSEHVKGQRPDFGDDPTLPPCPVCGEQPVDGHSHPQKAPGDYISQGYQQEIGLCIKEISKAVDRENEAHDRVVELRRKRRHLEAKYARHLDELAKP